MWSQNNFLPFGFWVGLPQNLGFDFSVRAPPGPLIPLAFLARVKQGLAIRGTCCPWRLFRSLM